MIPFLEKKKVNSMFKFTDKVLHRLDNATGLVQWVKNIFLIQLTIVSLLLMEVGISQIIYHGWLIGTIPCLLMLVVISRGAFLAYKKNLNKVRDIEPPH